jgi:hypothetical protein
MRRHWIATTHTMNTWSCRGMVSGSRIVAALVHPLVGSMLPTSTPPSTVSVG